jgi:hypothetical protein
MNDVGQNNRASEPKTYSYICETAGGRALDPSTPWEELVNLWIDQPQAMLDNPILALKSLNEGKSLHGLLPSVCRLSLYTYLIHRKDTKVLESYITEAQRLEDCEDLLEWQSMGKWSLLGRLLSRKPALVEDYVAALASDPSKNVRKKAAEKLPASHLVPFLKDSSFDVGKGVIKNLSNHRITLGSLWQNPDSDHPYAERFIKKPSEVVCDVLAIARKLQHHRHLCIRALNLAQDYAQDDMFEYACEHEKHWFFVSFAQCRDWRRSGMEGRSRDLLHRKIDQAFEGVPQVALTVVQDWRTDSRLLWRMTRHSQPSVNQAAWEAIKLEWPIDDQVVEETVEELIGKGFRSSWFEALARKEGLSRTTEKRLWGLGGTIRQALFDNPKPSREVAKELIKTKTADELIPLVHPSAHSFLVGKAARHEDPRLRAAAARLPGRPASSLRPQLVKDPDSSVRHAVADYYLAHSHTRYHGEHYAHTLSELTRDPDPEIRKKICRDWRISGEDLSQLVKDPVPEVALEVLSKRTWQCFQDSLPLFAVKEAAIREQAAKLVLWERASELKRYPTFFKKFESALLKDEHPALRWLLANDPWTSPQALNRLMKDPEPLIQKATISGFLQSAECPARDHFLEQANKGADDLLYSRNPWYRSCLALWDRKDRIRHRILTRDKHWFVRAVTALEPSLHPYLRDGLCRDRHPLVRAAVRDNLQFETENPYPTKA